jgi:hypothetical protein
MELTTMIAPQAGRCRVCHDRVARSSPKFAMALLRHMAAFDARVDPVLNLDDWHFLLFLSARWPERLPFITDPAAQAETNGPAGPVL